MKKVIHHLRGKSVDTKMQILNITIFLCAIVLVLFWTLSLRQEITNEDTQQKLSKELTPFNNLKADISETVNINNDTNLNRQ